MALQHQFSPWHNLSIGVWFPTVLLLLGCLAAAVRLPYTPDIVGVLALIFNGSLALLVRPSQEGTSLWLG